jgi:hypothetical protein
MYQTITEQVKKLTSLEQEKLFEILFNNIELFEKMFFSQWDLFNYEQGCVCVRAFFAVKHERK